MGKGNVGSLAETHFLSSGLKAYATELASEGIEATYSCVLTERPVIIIGRHVVAAVAVTDTPSSAESVRSCAALFRPRHTRHVIQSLMVNAC